MRRQNLKMMKVVNYLAALSTVYAASAGAATVTP